MENLQKGDQNHHYLILGAGPAGLQLGYYLQKFGRDYLILDRAENAGSFFATLPRHRKLISINKKYMGVLERRNNVDHDEVRLRFDWNSLLTENDEEERLKFTEYSDDYFPDADTYVKYLNDFVSKYQLKINYNTEIIKITKNESGLFVLIDQDGHKYRCSRLIIATGMSKPYIPSQEEFPGIDLAIGYEEMDMDLEKYRNKSILILGKGNSAFETAEHLIGVSGNIKMAGRHAAKFAWQTHYVGDLRALNNNYLDTYQLKSLNVIEEWDNHSLSRDENTGKIRYRGDDDIQFDYVFRCLGWKFDDSIFDFEIQPKLFKEKLPLIKETYESENIPGLYFAGSLAQSRDYKVSTTAFIHGFRYVSKFLAYHLERELRQDWPKQTFELDLDTLVGQILKLVNESSSIFQLFQHYCYLVVIRDGEFDIYQEVPIDYIKHFKELENHSFIVITMEYGFKKGEDVFNYSFVNYERYNGYNSKFVHPVLRLYPIQSQVKMIDKIRDQISLEERLMSKNPYTLCMCGCFEQTGEMKSQTICRRCQGRAHCPCGREDTIEWFSNNKACRYCKNGDTSMSTDNHRVFEHVRADDQMLKNDGIKEGLRYFHYEYHITEDVHNNFINGRQAHDIFYFIPLRRFLKTISEFTKVNVTGFYTDTWVNGTQRQQEYRKFHGLPVQYRFWSFFSYLVIRSPQHPEEEIVQIYPRIAHILNRREIRKNIKMALERLYPNDPKDIDDLLQFEEMD